MMLNNPMHKQETNPAETDYVADKKTRPDEQAGFAVEGFVRIFDPKTQEILVETRA